MNIKQLPWIIIAGLVAVILLMRGCEKPLPPEKPTIVTKIDTVWQERVITRHVYVPGVTRTVVQEVPAKVDTAAILADYFAKRYYRDSVKIDTLGYVHIEDTISQNRIVSRKTYGVYTVPIITKTVTITNPPERKNQVYIGPQLTAPVLGIGGKLTLKTKTDQLYGLSANYTAFGPLFTFDTGFKIKLRK